MTEGKYIYPHQILISSQVFLLQSMRKLQVRLRWSIGDYLQASRDLGIGFMYEPLRSGISPARSELEENPTRGKDIGMIAEPARTETKFLDYEFRRGMYQIFYAFLQQHRFTDETLTFLKNLQQAVSSQERPIPVRVYAPKEGYHSAILDDGLTHKIYAQDHGTVVKKVTAHMQGASEKEKIERVVQELVSDGEQYNVSGIELNVLGLMTALQHHPNLIFGVIRALLQRSTLVQSVAIQPKRPDLSENIMLNEMKHVINILVECGFAGPIIYNPGPGSDMRQEVTDLKQMFSNY